jgi:hypothetical protein
VKYRFTLQRKSDKLILKVSEWSGQCFENNEINLITAQIIEDFTKRDYFMQIVNKIFYDAEKPAKAFEYAWSFNNSNCNNVISRLNILASPQRYGRTGEDYTGLIGNTPMIKLKNLAKGCKATVLVKLESMEPNSVKDRPVYSIISKAIERGEITDETEVIEASSGNMAFAISAILKIMMGKKPKIFMSEMHGETKIKTVRISGSPVVLTPKSEGTLSAKRESIAYARDKKNVFQVNQHGNPDNYRAHRFTTGPELYHQ